MNAPLLRAAFVATALSIAVSAAARQPAHYTVFVLTGQSNALGTTNGGEADPTPGTDAADARVRFFWHNWADKTTSLGDSGGTFTDLGAQQGGYYPGSAMHWGPEIGFGRTLARAGVQNAAIVKCEIGRAHV